jgi:hypothetical protein
VLEMKNETGMDEDGRLCLKDVNQDLFSSFMICDFIYKFESLSFVL